MASKVVAGLAGAFLVSLALSAATRTAQSQEAPRFAFEGDVVRAAGPGAKGAPCVLNSQFKHGEVMLFRIRLVDPKTGKSLDEKAVKSMQVQLSNGETAPMTYHPHPPGPKPTDWFWVGGWPVPDTQPTGSLSYKIVVTDLDGKSYNWSPFNVASSQITVIDD